ncbi:hypothetical protein LRS06_21640 [Hymenobacter sp. J193]|uniref:hypothetical protein n=1 Tax=Hymenobacter sp. J193 TaxID=2898429 RepID=UPI002151D810|nr:hypothetical protein [Hymenobacter sp. J193]MCR5890333.1 hypothetical protein [Hymenobacter sp. J193]
MHSTLTAGTDSSGLLPSCHWSWQDQLLPAPLISLDLAEVVALGLLRQQPETRGLVGISVAQVIETLRAAGISTSLLLLTGRDQLVPDLVLQTTPDEAAAFDALHAQVLCAPQPAEDLEAATWLRQRRLSHLRLLAMGKESAQVFLPDLDAGWQSPATGKVVQPSMLRWLLQSTPLLLAGAVSMVVYIYNAGPSPALWPLFLLPLLGAMGFGGLLFRRLSSYRQSVAQAWLARPARLRPNSVAVARNLARRPWQLLYLPVLLVLGAFVALLLLLAGSMLTTISSMTLPIAAAVVLLLGLTYRSGRKYLNETREHIQLLPAPLLPVNLSELWLPYLYY